MKQKIKKFLGSVVAIMTLISAIVSIIAIVAFFLDVAEAVLFLAVSLPVFFGGALLLTFVIKDGWQRFFTEVFSFLPF